MTDLTPVEGPRAICPACGSELLGSGTLTHNPDGSHGWAPMTDTADPVVAPRTPNDLRLILEDGIKSLGGKHRGDLARALDDLVHLATGEVAQFDPAARAVPPEPPLPPAPDARDALREALVEVEERLDTLYESAAMPQEDPERWAQGVWFTLECARAALRDTAAPPPVDVERLARAMDSVWPSHSEGMGGTGNAETRYWEVMDPAVPSKTLVKRIAAAYASDSGDRGAGS